MFPRVSYQYHLNRNSVITSVIPDYNYLCCVCLELTRLCQCSDPVYMLCVKKTVMSRLRIAHYVSGSNPRLLVHQGQIVCVSASKSRKVVKCELG